jgi:thymidylate kinase
MFLRLILFYIIFCFSYLHTAETGKLVAFVGISGSGKSTLTKEVAQHFKGECFLEPEEDSWPDFVRQKQPYGEFGSLMTIRSIRVHSLWKAWDVKQKGEWVFVDTYYDKINYYNLGKPGMEWLIDPNDTYFDIAKDVTYKDFQSLPDVDLIVFIDIDYESWIQLLRKRNREKDFIEGFQESYSFARKYLLEAIQDLSQKRKIPFIIFEQKIGDLTNQAAQLSEKIKEQGAIHE